eukprot:1160177-Pelagomonas_calceolata.AAC.2
MSRGACKSYLCFIITPTAACEIAFFFNFGTTGTQATERKLKDVTLFPPSFLWTHPPGLPEGQEPLVMDATSEHPAGLDAQFSAGTCTKPFANEHVITKRQNFKIKGDELLRCY